ncbi:MAG: hypothetical protein KGL39_00395 [Patescibacteria group bacterium]|nr:hypothetical protein [Patescibacteria group bacterium]
MLLPFEWAVLTMEEAHLLKEYIEKTTAIKGLPVNYKGMTKVGMREIHSKLCEFVRASTNYMVNLQFFNPDDYAETGHVHDHREG